MDDFIEDIYNYKILITYNGKSFDIPFIENYFNIKLNHAQIDLRYLLSSLGYKGGLKRCEQQLGIFRSALDGVDGYFAIHLWNDYYYNGNRLALETLLAYNIEDTINLEKLMEISDVETFWRTFNNIPKSYDIFSDGINIKKIKRVNAIPCAYSFFRNDIFPYWEDPMNTNGFEYSIKNGNDLKKLDSEWMECILYLIGDEDPIMCHINGIRMVDCTKYSSVLYRMEIWIDNEKYKSC